MYFDLKKTGIYQAIKWGRNPLFKYRKFFESLFFVLTIILAGAGVFGLIEGGFSKEAVKKFAGGAVLTFCFGVIFWELGFFYNSKLKKPKLKYSLSQALQSPEGFNFASFLDLPLTGACEKALNFCKKKTALTSLKEALLYFLILSKSPEMNFVFQRGGLERKQLKEILEKNLAGLKEKSEVGFENIMLEAAKIAQQRGKEKIGAGDILLAFAVLDPAFQKFLVESDFRKEDIENLIAWYERVQQERTRLACWWSQENLLKKGSIGKDWVSGYTINLDRYSLDLRDQIRKNIFREIVGHQKEIRQIEQILGKEELNNVLLVGEPGTGRKAIVEAVTQRAFLGMSSPAVNHKRILSLDFTAVAVQTASQEEAELALEKCFQDARLAGNVILLIDNIHNFVAEHPSPGAINVAGILSRYLALSAFQIIAVTTYEGLHQIIERNPSFANLFEKVEAREISEADTLLFLENYVPFFENKHKRYISYRSLREIIKISSRYLAQAPFPEKAVRLLDEAMSYLSLYTKDPILQERHIKKVVSEKTEIPLEALEEKEKEMLLKLEDLIHERLINQEEAVKEVSAALRRARAEVNIKSGPIGSFLFLGPTGVGKTETAKALAAIYFGSEQRMLRFDMSEFQIVEDIKRMIGSPKEDGLLTTAVKEKPFSLVLLDELEKAHPNILTLFLQVLDEGWLTDGMGRKVYFRNTIIIATSNAGAEIIQEDIKKNKGLTLIKDDLLDYFFKQRIFRPEFINRFDAVIVFKPLTKESLLQIAGLMLKKLAKNLLDKGIKFEITEALKEKIVELSYNPAFGAREMKRVLQDKVENVLANALLSGELKRGSSIRIDPNDFRLLINPRQEL